MELKIFVRVGEALKFLLVNGFKHLGVDRRQDWLLFQEVDIEVANITRVFLIVYEGKNLIFRRHC